MKGRRSRRGGVRRWGEIGKERRFWEEEKLRG